MSRVSPREYESVAIEGTKIKVQSNLVERSDNCDFMNWLVSANGITTGVRSIGGARCRWTWSVTHSPNWNEALYHGEKMAENAIQMGTVISGSQEAKITVISGTNVSANETNVCHNRSSYVGDT